MKTNKGHFFIFSLTLMTSMLSSFALLAQSLPPAKAGDDVIPDEQVISEIKDYLSHLNGANASPLKTEEQLTFLTKIKNLWKIPEFRELRAMPLEDILKIESESPNPYFITALAFHNDDIHEPTKLGRGNPLGNLPQTEKDDIERAMKFRDQLRMQHIALDPFYIGDEARSILAIHPELKYVVYDSVTDSGDETQVILQDLNTSKGYVMFSAHSREEYKFLAAINSDGTQVALMYERGIIVFDTSSYPPTDTHVSNQIEDLIPSQIVRMYYTYDGKGLVILFPNANLGEYNLTNDTWKKSHYIISDTAEFLDRFLDQQRGDFTLDVLKEPEQKGSIRLHYGSYNMPLNGNFLFLSTDNRCFKIAVCTQSEIKSQYGICIFDYENNYRKMHSLNYETAAPLAMAFSPIEPSLYVIRNNGSLDIYNYWTKNTVNHNISKLINFYPKFTHIYKMFFFDGGTKLAVVTQDDDGLYAIHKLEKSTPSLDLLYLIDPDKISGEKK